MNISVTGIFEFFNASPMDAMIVVIAVMLVIFCRSMIHQIRAAVKELKLETIKHHDDLKAAVKLLDHQYKQVDKLTLIISHEVHHLGGAQTVKLNHNGEHEILNPIFEEPKKSEPPEKNHDILIEKLSELQKNYVSEALKYESMREKYVKTAERNSSHQLYIMRIKKYLEIKGLTSGFKNFLSDSESVSKTSL